MYKFIIHKLLSYTSTINNKVFQNSTFVQRLLTVHYVNTIHNILPTLSFYLSFYKILTINIIRTTMTNYTL